MNGYKKYIAAALVVAVLALSGVAFAHFANSSQTINSTPAVIKVNSEQPKASATQSTAQPQTTTKTDGPCTTTTTSDIDDTPPDTHNNSSTVTDCSGSSSGGSVNISNNSHQTATTGDSTGQSGNASNNDSTNINVSQ